jgi:predicted cupin superfamily sugar epimerase
MPSLRPIARDIIDRLGLTPHPEGGYFRETHRDATRVARLAPGDTMLVQAPRAAATGIYYLLCDGAYSAWHRIDADEMWHFYAGGPVDIHMIDENGRLSTCRLGNALVHEGARFQAVVPAGCWFAAECVATSAVEDLFALVGCTVAPGFEFSAFELADASALAARYPSHTELLTRLAPCRRPAQT